MTRLVKIDVQGNSGAKYLAIFSTDGVNSAYERRSMARAYLVINCLGVN